jgi:tellurite resistance protein TerC
MGNVFALLGLRALFVLVEGLIRRFRYLDETIALVLAVVAVKLLVEDIYKLPAVGSLALVLGLLAGGMVLSLMAERRDARRAPLPAPEPEPEPPQARLTRDEDPQLRHH